jgi:hypothetical protein
MISKRRPRDAPITLASPEVRRPCLTAKRLAEECEFRPSRPEIGSVRRFLIFAFYSVTDKRDVVAHVVITVATSANVTACSKLVGFILVSWFCSGLVGFATRSASTWRMAIDTDAISGSKRIARRNSSTHNAVVDDHVHPRSQRLIARCLGGLSW